MRLLLLCLLVLCVVWNAQAIPTIKLDTSKLEIPVPNTSPDEDKDKPGNFEGDMILSKEQKKIVNSMIEDEEKNQKGEMTREKRKHYYLAQLWPGGNVPFESLGTGDFANDQTTKDAINGAMRHIMTQTCIKFSQVTTGDRLRFVRGSGGCYSRLGKTGGVQNINLGRGCGTMGIATHEILHALGFMHEQSRPDRDKYVTINYGAIQWGMENNFRKYASDETRLYDIPYDLGSLMHYGARFFSKDGRTPTILPKDPSKESLMGQRAAMSSYDGQIVRATYKCSGSGTGSTSGITHGTPCFDLATNCSQLSTYCNYPQVLQYCPKTCNKCTVT